MSNCKLGDCDLWRYGGRNCPNDVMIECKAIFSSVLEGILRQKTVRLDQTSPETLARILADELETEQRKSVE